ncbi:solute carrier family 12 member 9 isoform X1 [Cavia porcellus]|uniref:Solute carrier family 12 member 9 n=1 Tax=Cavia porcellus TaxID=10141 RepID=H0UWW8_CAVPO|nr:solute carrier family 12 member 9 [Cavia porcellus]XP_013008221.1 solute carrier family 12 member 9 [Cavia porcellus]XP_013008222.1 solute carrier family 12 member 9 [Cavia porcellus]XP_013008223.1 solute carrier family 12 member 9 [Cavia porcellus]
MASESSPLLAYRLLGEEGAALPTSGAGGSGGAPARKLSTFLGVVVPTVLSMFSIVVFLRIGFVVGHAGLLQALAMLLVAYIILALTVLSVCAIATNGAVRGGGAYFMISRTLGPEVGGSIGLMFYLANVCGCAVSLLGLVEAVLDVFGADPTGSSGLQVLPQGYGWNLLYGSLLLGLVGGVCTLGAGLYARASFLTFLLVSGSLASVLISFVAVVPKNIPLAPRPGANGSSLPTRFGHFTGFNTSTLKDNLGAGYAEDYTTGAMMTFASVFAVLFNGCTGIMAGANMSGELKDPSRAIPLGTIIAVAYTFFIYILLFFLSSFTCDRTLLQENYGFFRAISLWPPLVLIGIYATSLSASMSSLIGASRILHALAQDDLFGVILAPAKVVSGGGNPWGAVLYSWGLVQLVLLAGKLNTLAAVVTVFYLVAYAAVDLSCLSLEWASAPNFRPTFSLFSWHTCLLGVASCLLMMFLISPGAAGGSLLLMGLLSALLTARGGPSSWGYVSQALLFHQVRKYLLRLDVRKDHVKFWRPQLLLLVGNPRGALPLLRLANQLKKGGLYVLGHVTLGDLDMLPSDPVQPQYGAWLSLVDRAQVKAFVDLTLSPSVRQGAQHLLRISGLGGMKPNTLVLGFYDDAPPQDHFLTDPAFMEPADGTQEGGSPALSTLFPPPRAPGSPRALSPQDYVATVADALKMNKNVVLARACGALPPERLNRGSGSASQLHHVDVWPLNLLRPRGGPGYVDVCGLFLLQMATILGMVPAWHSARLRIFLCLGPREAPGAAEGRLRALLSQLRIRAEVHEVVWGEGAGAGEQEEEEEGDFVNGGRGDAEAEALACSANTLVRAQQGRGTGGGPGGPKGRDGDEGPITALTFLYLPRPPADPARYPRYLALLETLSQDLGPTLLIHGVTPVTCTDL